MTYVKKAPPKHYCRPPDPMGTNDDWIISSSLDSDDDVHAPILKPGVRLPQVGDVWECDDCGAWWELYPPHRYTNAVSFTKRWIRKWRPWWRR